MPTLQAFDVAVGRAVLDDEGLFRVSVRGRNVLWIPDSDKPLQLRLMICAHMRDAGHRGVAATLVRLQEYCAHQNLSVSCGLVIIFPCHDATRSEDFLTEINVLMFYG